MLLKLLRKILVLFAGLFFFAVIVMIAAYVYVAPELPSADAIRNIHVQTPLRVYSREGELVSVFGDKRRIPVTLDQVPQRMINGFLAAEDDRFFEHPGVDYEGLMRAALKLLETGQKTQGGSTITMQLARNFFLTNQRTFERKIKEVYLALIIERLFEKKEILNLYLNKIFLGKRAYGVAAAAEVYYGKPLGELTLAQTAMIAGLPKAPSFYNPLANPDKAIERRNYVLNRMRELEMISQDEYETALAAGVTARPHVLQVELQAPYVAEMARKWMVERYGSDAYIGGFEVYTTLDAQLQRKAQASLRKGLLDYDRRHGWRRVQKQFAAEVLNDEEQLEKALGGLSNVGGLHAGIVIDGDAETLRVALKDGGVVSLPPSAWQWAQPYINVNFRGAPPEKATDVAAVGSVVHVLKDAQEPQLAQEPEVSGALVAMDTERGGILALVGGFDFYRSKFNRAVQARRQTGSNFKPFIYSAALAEGYTPASIVKDTPVVFTNSRTNLDWRPENYSGKFFGPTRLREALKRSRNLISVKLVDAIGINKTLDYARRFGFDRSDLPHNLTLALGSGVATPLQIARAYAVFANGGFRMEPYWIEKISDGKEVLFKASPLALCAEGCAEDEAEDEAEEYVSGAGPGVAVGVEATAVFGPLGAGAEQFAPRAIPADVAYQVTSMMQDVIREGTGRRARSLRRSDIAGKTGTTNEQRDAWFSGFNREIVCTTWLGFDDHKPLGNRETGAVSALPIWIDFMGEALKERPERDYYKPSNIITAQIDRHSGLLAHPGDDEALTETFRSEYLPKEIAEPRPVGSGTPATDIEGLF